MRQRVFFSLVVAMGLALSTAALAQSGERAAGRRLATELCGDCHQVRPPFPLFYRYPPTFEEIAKLSSTTRLSLKVFLQSNHTIMPNFIVSKSDTDDIIAEPEVTVSFFNAQSARICSVPNDATCADVGSQCPLCPQ
jgi:mono/diheme cytochrome c family protein